MGERTYEEKKPGRQNDPAPAPLPSKEPASPYPAFLQRIVGNQAVQQALQSEPASDSLGPVHGPQLLSPAEEIAALEREAERRETERTEAASTAESGLSRIVVPLEALVIPPGASDDETVYLAMLSDPENAEAIGRRFAANDALGEYLDDKLDWPITIELEDHGGQTWFLFSAQGEQLVATRRLELPIQSLDRVSDEMFSTVIDRVAEKSSQMVEAALLESAFHGIVKGIGNHPQEMLDDPDDFALNQVRAESTIAGRYFQKLEALFQRLGSETEWLRSTVGARQDEFRSIRDATARADQFMHTDHFHKKEDLSRTYGEVYDDVIEDAVAQGGVLGWGNKWSGKTLKFLGDLFTLGGQSLDADNARMFRVGEISYNDFKSNRRWNILRVAVNAVATALTAGRASGAVTRLLGLEAGTLAGAAAGGMAEGAAGGFVQAFTSDVYAETIVLTTDSPGVRAFHEQTIGGPEAWLSATGWGGVAGGGFGVAGHFVPKAPPKPVTPEPGAELPPGSTDPEPSTAQAASSEPLASTAEPTPLAPDVVEPPTATAVSEVTATQNPLLEPEPAPSVVIEDIDIAIAGDEEIERRIPGNARLRSPTTGDRIMKYQVFEADSTTMMGGDPAAPKAEVPLSRPVTFSGEPGPQLTVEPDFLQEGVFAEFKDRKWEGTTDFIRESNTMDLAASLEKIYVADELSGVSRGAPVQVVTSRRLPFKMRKAILREMRRWMREEWGASNTQIGAFEERIRWMWRRPKLPR